MTDLPPTSRTNQGRQRRASKRERATSRPQDVRGQPQASRSDRTQPQTTAVTGGGVEQMTIQDAVESSLSNLPQRGTGLTPAAAGRGQKWFKKAMPPHVPSTREVAEPTKSREPGLPLRDRRNEGRKLDLLIVTEFMIARQGHFLSRDRFVENVSRIYNEEVPVEYPRMSRWPEKVYPGTSQKWHLFDEIIFGSDTRSGPGGLGERKLRLVSPLLQTSDSKSDSDTPPWHPPWKQVIQTIWTHLNSKYDIRTNSDCTTRVHLVNDEPYTLPQLKQLASAIIQFEPVMTVLKNNHHHQDPSHPGSRAKRNWRDNPRLGGHPANLTHADSIALIESITPNPKHGDTAPLLELIHPSPSSSSANDDGREYCWSLHDIASSGLIRHCKLPACRTAEDSIRWAELTTSFVLAALACRTQDLRKMQPTNKGLRAFMSGVRSGEWRVADR